MTTRQIDVLRKFTKSACETARGDEIASGVIKLVKSMSDEAQALVGDKNGRPHGNKGVIAEFFPKKDMPVSADGRRWRLC